MHFRYSSALEEKSTDNPEAGTKESSASNSTVFSFQTATNAFSGLTSRGMQYLTEMITPNNRQDDSSAMEKKEIYCVSFNQDCSCLAVGHEDGYTFYSLRSIDRLEKINEGKVPERVCVVERLYLSSLITIVSIKSTRKLQVYHSIKENEICCHTYASAILAVRMNRKRVVVCLEDSIHVHNVRDMRLMHMIKDTPLNPQGIMDLSNDESACYLAFPGAPGIGHVMVFDAEALVAVCSFSAHAGSLAALKFNPDGTKLATASDKGTVIRVFGIPNGDRLFEFTRGMKRCVSISSLAFSADSKYLCLSSNTETIHVFSLVKPTEAETGEPSKQDDLAATEGGLGAWVNPLTSFFSQQASAYLPQHMNELMLREKSVATARLPIVGTRTVVAMPRINGVDYLVVASTDGYLFCYTLDNLGGECTLMRQYKIGPHQPADDGLDNGTPIPIGSRGGGASAPLYPQLVDQDQQFGKSPRSDPLRPIAGTGSSSSSVQSLSQSPPGAAPVQVQAKPAPPPIPPAPKKRNTPPPGVGTSSKAKPTSTNPFEMDDAPVSPVKQAAKSRRNQRKDDQSDSDGSNSGGGLGDLIPPADLNDMDEFPPLNHATI
ncbi:WD repeat domain phosphoinositide-interacting protein 2 [Ditylenchus destructor]|uniref:WD repeat domain phosphoinositide-interacting protein 2 n=1 Tax=Ditylenchus destructor TaxID=166010 RepID=A0AAD4R7H8_9BILA|nr:WD repeat domain phosphoinositide-interacting protein 2 [Ditylenchus destructor]